VRPLPSNATVESLRAEGEPEATAKSYGFADWAELVRFVELITPYAFDPEAPPRPDETAADSLIRHACLDYGSWRPSKLDDARRMLDADPDLGRANIFAAAATGDVAAVRAMLDADRSLANARGGPFLWVPLMYACYSRMPPDGGHSTLEVARVLLAAGANPDVGFLWCGLLPGSTALTGVFGEGEHGNNYSRHPEREALARVLLEAGADPNDEQTLYNCHFYPDNRHLEILFEYGLGGPHRGWSSQFGSRQSTPAQMLEEELWCAARTNFRPRVDLLLAHGVNVDVPGRRNGKTPTVQALDFGNVEIAEQLIARGAKRPDRTTAQQFVTACVRGDATTARALIAERAQLSPERRMELVGRAVEADHLDGIRLMAELGFELSIENHATPLHQASWSGNLVLVQLFVELGASTSVRDPVYSGRPLDWALHNHQHAVADWLRPHS